MRFRSLSPATAVGLAILVAGCGSAARTNDPTAGTTATGIARATAITGTTAATTTTAPAATTAPVSTTGTTGPTGFVASGNAICTSYDTQIDTLAPQGSTLQSALTRLRTVAKLAEATQLKLEHLTAPSIEQAAYAKALAADAKTVSVLKDELADLTADKTKAFNALVSGAQQRLGANANADFQKIDLTQCASGTRASSTPHFATHATAICTAANKQITALPAPAHTFQSISKTASNELLIVKREITELQALAPPPSERGIFLATLSIMNQDVGIDQKAIVAENNQNASRIKKLAAETSSITTPLASFDRRLGITPCENNVYPEARA